MDRRKALATTGAVSLTATAAIVALGSSMGLFGLANADSTRVGKLSPIDTTVREPATEVHTVIVDDPPPAAAAGSGSVAANTARPGAGGEHREHSASSSPTSSGNVANSPTMAGTTAPPATDGSHLGDDHHTDPTEDHTSTAPDTSHADD
jgi:hypothetical protein